MQPTDLSVDSHVAGVTPATRRRDAETLIAIMRELTGREPRMWGTIIGFGACHYRYPTGNEGDMPLLCFAPRKAATTIYLMDGVGAHEAALATLGPHKTGVGCLYLKDLDTVDLDVLKGMLTASLAFGTSGGSDMVTITVTD